MKTLSALDIHVLPIKDWFDLLPFKIIDNILAHHIDDAAATMQERLDQGCIDYILQLENLVFPFFEKDD